MTETHNTLYYLRLEAEQLRLEGKTEKAEGIEYAIERILGHMKSNLIHAIEFRGMDPIRAKDAVDECCS